MIRIEQRINAKIIDPTEIASIYIVYGRNLEESKLKAPEKFNKDKIPHVEAIRINVDIARPRMSLPMLNSRVSSNNCL